MSNEQLLEALVRVVDIVAERAQEDESSDALRSRSGKA